jgi:hypothetical protein
VLGFAECICSLWEGRCLLVASCTHSQATFSPAAAFYSGEVLPERWCWHPSAQVRLSAGSETKQASDNTGRVRTSLVTKAHPGSKARSICTICSLTCSFGNSFSSSLEGASAPSLPRLPLVNCKISKPAAGPARRSFCVPRLAWVSARFCGDGELLPAEDCFVSCCSHRCG